VIANRDDYNKKMTEFIWLDLVWIIGKFFIEIMNTVYRPAEPHLYWLCKVLD
jgi:hypothetical protein